MQQFKSALDDSGDLQVALTEIYQIMLETLQTDFRGHNNKKAKSNRDGIELLGIMKSSLQSLIASARTMLETDASDLLWGCKRTSLL